MFSLALLCLAAPVASLPIATQCKAEGAQPAGFATVGQPIDLTPELMGGDVYFPTIEFNPDRAEFLLALGVNDDVILARRVSLAGVPGPVRTVAGAIVASQLRPVLAPALAYDQATGHYLAAYRRLLLRGDPLNPFACRLQSPWIVLLDGEADPVDRERQVSTAPYEQGAFEATLHDLEGDKGFVHFGRMLQPTCSPGSQGRDFLSTAIDRNGAPFATTPVNDFVPGLGSAPLGRPAYDCKRGRFLATWVHRLPNGDYHLDGRLVAPGGTTFGPSFTISESDDLGGSFSSAVYDPVRDRFLVVYPTFQGREIRARLVGPDGALVSKERLLVANTGQRTGPALLRPRESGVFLLGWLQSNVSARVRTYDLDLNQIATLTLASQGLGEAAEEFWPSFAEDTCTGHVLFVWPDGRNFPKDGEWDVFGQFLQPIP